MSQEPLFWYRPRSDGGYEGPLHNGQIEDARKESGAWVPLFAGAAPVSAEPVGMSLEIRTLGNYGAAFDSPGNRRAYTYDHQPGNIKASRLGSACLQAAAASAGDTIDRGLGLLKELQAQGFGVFDAESSRWHAAPVAAQPDLTQQTLDDVMAGIPARNAEIEALRKEIETLRAQQDADKVDAERWRAYRASAAADDAGFLQRALNAIEAMGLEDGQLPSEDQIDAAIDAARKENV